MRTKGKRSEKKNWPRRLLRRCVGESGATFLEYALLASIIAIGVGAGVTLFGDALLALFKELTIKILHMV